MVEGAAKLVLGAGVLVTGAAVVTAGAAVVGTAYAVGVGNGAEGEGTLLAGGAAVDVTAGEAVLVTAGRSVSAVSSQFVLWHASLGLAEHHCQCLPGRHAWKRGLH